MPSAETWRRCATQLIGHRLLKHRPGRSGCSRRQVDPDPLREFVDLGTGSRVECVHDYTNAGRSQAFVRSIGRGTNRREKREPGQGPG